MKKLLAFSVLFLSSMAMAGETIRFSGDVSGIVCQKNEALACASPIKMQELVINLDATDRGQTTATEIVGGYQLTGIYKIIKTTDAQGLALYKLRLSIEARHLRTNETTVEELGEARIRRFDNLKPFYLKGSRLEVDAYSYLETSISVGPTINL